MPELVQQIGAAAGFAAVAGLAALLGLYFSHARDVKRLREWAAAQPVPERTVGRAPRRSQPWHRRVAARHVAAALVGLLVLGGAAAQLTGGRDDSRTSSAVTRGSLTVAVLNGTMVPGLAARLRDRIAAAGYKRGTIDDFSDKQLAESVVQYAPGHKAQAKAVGRTLGIVQRAPATAASSALAQGAPVIVIAGADKSR